MRCRKVLRQTHQLSCLLASLLLLTSAVFAEESTQGQSSSCTYSISPTSQSFPAGGGSGSISVSTQEHCQWTAKSNDFWVIIESPNKASGTGTINFLLPENLGPESRSAQIAVEGQMFHVKQGGTPEAVEYALTVKRTGSGQGTVTTSPTGPLFRKGSSVTLNAVPDADSTFSGWSGACSGTARTCSVRVNAATSVTASFSSRTFTISIAPSSNGIVYPPGPVRAGYGEKRTFQIIPLPGYHVSDVRVDRVSVGAVTSYTFKSIMSDHLIEAAFVKE